MNGLVGWYEGRKADDAIAALKNALSPRCSVVRDGREISGYDASQLVPGDIVKLAFGNAVPADCKILGTREIRVDQAALTGESIPKRMGKGDVAKMGSTLTDGECEAVVVATGSHTFSAGLRRSSTLHRTRQATSRSCSGRSLRCSSPLRW